MTAEATALRWQVGPGGRRLAGSLAPGQAAYLDAEWVCAGGPAVAALVLPAVDDRLAARTLAALAAAAATAAGASATVEVLGRGVVAREVERRLGDRVHVSSDDRPSAIVDTTGEPSTIVAATQRLADGGRLVLAGEAQGRTTSVGLYPDVHRRELELLGVPSPLGDGLAPEDAEPDALLLDTLEAVSFGDLARDDAFWIRVTG